MKKIIKVIIILGFSLVTVSFVQMSSDVQEVPDYCMLAVCRRDKYFDNMNSPTGQNEQLIATKQA